MLLFLGQWIRCRNFLYDVVVFSNDDRDLIFLVSPLVSRIRRTGHTPTLRCACVALWQFGNYVLLPFLFWNLLWVSPFLTNLSFGTVTILRSFCLFWLLSWKSIDVFSQAFSRAHLIFAHKIWQVLQELGFHFVEFEFCDFVFIP